VRPSPRREDLDAEGDRTSRVDRRGDPDPFGRVHLCWQETGTPSLTKSSGCYERLDMSQPFAVGHLGEYQLYVEVSQMRSNPSPLHPDESLWTVPDVAAYLRVSRSWVYQHAEANKLPHRRLGGLLRFDPAEIRAYAASSGASANVVPFPAPP